MAKQIKLSATRINLFLQCRQRYCFNYIDHYGKISNPAFKLGLACHGALEFAGKIWKKKRKFTASDKKKIIAEYTKISVEEGISDLEMHSEGIMLVKRRVDNFDLGYKIIGLEEKFGFGENSDIIIDDEVPLIGAIDKAIEVDEDTLLIVDYKTSKFAPTTGQMRVDAQLSIYDLAARIKWPQYKRVILCLDLLKSDILYTYRTDEEREDFTEYIKEVYKQMLAFKREDAKANLNMFCPWCDYKDYCDTYKAACKNTDYKFLSIYNYSDEELIGEWKHVRDIKKILDRRERELSMVVIEKIKKGAENLRGENESLYIRQNSRTTYDLDTVYKSVPEEVFPKLVNLNKKAVETYIEANPVIRDRIVKSATTNFTSPFIASKKIKIKSKTKTKTKKTTKKTKK